ncbi:12586_t:CDS:2, partial [Ambispora leptoticha]
SDKKESHKNGRGDDTFNANNVDSNSFDVKDVIIDHWQNGQQLWSISEDSTFAKDGETIVTVGHPSVNSVVPLDLLRYIYLPEHPHHRLLDPGTRTISYLKARSFFPVKLLNLRDKKRILVTGGAGFNNLDHWIGHPNFELIRHDVVDPFMIEVDQIYHLACPASPPHYQYNPIKTIKTSVMGTINMLGLAKRVKARFLLTSTSEVYGDPEEHPQPETYWGNVNPIGPRACYDEGKRVAETLTYGYMHQDNVDVRVARIFNTFGPRMNENDGRVVSNFIMQALKGEDLTIYGDGQQTRSFQYIHDLIDGLILLMNSDYKEPVNLGNPDEYTIMEFAEFIRNEVNPNSKHIRLPGTTDDPKQRKPDISRASEFLGWSPRWSLKQGINETVQYFRQQLAAGIIEC